MADTDPSQSMLGRIATSAAAIVASSLLIFPASAQDNPLTEPAVTEERLAVIANGDPVRGRVQAQRCAACHSFAELDTTPRAGPGLYGVAGRIIGTAEEYSYSAAFGALRDKDFEWTVERLEVFLADPVAAAPGTAMTIGQGGDPAARANIIAFLIGLAPDETADGTDRALADRIADADIGDGELLATRCAGCHAFEPGGETLVGPNLYEVVGATVGRTQGFAYSLAFQSMNVVGAEWTYTRLDSFLKNPQNEIPGTRMGFGGIEDNDQRAAIIAYLRTLSDDPLPPPGALVAEGAVRGVFQPELGPLVFTATQVQFGSRYYSQIGCDRCHAGNLAGLQDSEAGAPALVGQAFAENWFGRNVDELYRYIALEMPADFTISARGIDDSFLLMIVAFILERNGFLADDAELPADRASQRAMGFYQ